MNMSLYQHADAQSAAQSCAQHVLAILKDTLSVRDYATVAVSGGSTPKLLFEALAVSGFHWDRVHFFWVDERCVPPDNALSNYKLTYDNLIHPANIPAAQVHRIHGELAPQVAAERYVREILEFFQLQEGEMPQFDIVQRGMGHDAHTASLFPGEPLIEDQKHIAAAVYAKRMSQWRVTLLPGVLSAARNTIFLVTGADKAPALHSVLRGKFDPARYPAQIAARDERAAWFVDQAAAASLD